MKMIFLLCTFLSLEVMAQAKVTDEQIASYLEKNTTKITEQDFFKDLLHKELLKEVDRIKKTSVVDLTKELIEKEERIRQKERELSKRENQLKNSEEHFSTRIREFEKTQKGILGCMEENGKNEQLRISKMVKVISNMRPIKAAELLAEQESNISVKILGALDPEKASKIFNQMEKETSARLQKEYLNMKK